MGRIIFNYKFKYHCFFPVFNGWVMLFLAVWNLLFIFQDLPLSCLWLHGRNLNFLESSPRLWDIGRFVCVVRLFFKIYFILKYIKMIFFYFLIIIFNIYISKRFKIYIKKIFFNKNK
jgi:hypothetical protein